MEKTKKFRENLMLNDPEKWSAFKQKERERAATSRKEREEYTSRSSREKHHCTAEERRKAAEDKRKYRAKIKLSKNTSEIPYKCKQSLFKAVARVCKVMPDRIDRKNVVLREMLKKYDPKASRTLKESEMQKVNQIQLDLIKTKKYEHVKQFFLRDDLSYQTPGISDVMSIRDPYTHKRVLCNKRYMIMSISEAYEMYKNEQDEHSLVYKTKFYELRPQNVLVVSDTPNNVCVCLKHSNFNLLCKSLKNVLGFPLSSKKLIEDMCCDVFDEDCMNNKCTNCQTDLRDILPILFEYNTYIYWNQWEKNKETGRFKISKHNGKVSDAIGELQEQLSRYKVHSHVNRIQTDYFRDCKNLASDENVTIQIDFAENFAIRNQDEIQAAHFSYDQVTIFTACAWTESEHRSFVIVSNDLNHDKFAVWEYLNVLLKLLQNKAPTIKNVHIFSDGCTAQFKNRFILSKLPYLQTIHKLNISWSFFATSHGKGAVDGIGGTVKRSAWNGIKSRRVQIDSASDFAQYVTKTVKGVNILYVDKEKVDDTRKLLAAEWAKAKKIPNLQNQHHFEITNDGHLVASPTQGSKINITI